MMRRWRVGSFSMGLSLLMLGVLLFLSQVLEQSIHELFSLWWPCILIVLGLEILVHLVWRKEEQPVLKYDVLSIFFVSVIGSVGILFALLTSTGVWEHIEAAVTEEEKSYELPSAGQSLSEVTKRIVIQSNHLDVNLEGMEGDEWHAFGSYRWYNPGSSQEKAPIEKVDDYLITRQVGDTLFIELLEPSSFSGLVSSSISLDLTLVVPVDRQVEIRNERGDVDVYIPQTEADWFLEAQHVRLHLSDPQNMFLTARSNSPLVQGNQPWDDVKMEEEMDLYIGTMKFGDGQYSMVVNAKDRVHVDVRQ